MDLDPPRAAALGAVSGGVVAAVAVLGEAWVRDVSLLQLQTHSVTVWVVEMLPLMLGLAGWGVAERQAMGSEGTAPSAPKASPRATSSRADDTPSVPPPAPAYVPTPAPAPPRSQLRTKTLEAPPRLQLDPRLRSHRLLYVDAHPDAPAVVSDLQGAGLDVIHVRDPASGSLARDPERITIAAVDPAAEGGEGLVGELLRHRICVVRLGLAPTTTARLRTVDRPVDSWALARALAELLDE